MCWRRSGRPSKARTASGSGAPAHRSYQHEEGALGRRRGRHRGRRGGRPWLDPVTGKSLFDFPVHLGRGARAVEEPQFTGPEWYEQYGERHGDDLDEGRLVSLFRFEEPWTSWEMHPAGDEVVCCVQGHMTLHQELPDG